MVEIKLDADTLRLFSMFERTTGAQLKDVFEDGDRSVFVVEDGQLGKALGKGAQNLRRLREGLQKEIVLVAYSADRDVFLRNVFHRFEVESIEWEDRNGDIIAHVRVPATEKGKAIGKAGRNVQLARTLMKRHHQVADVSVE